MRTTLIGSLTSPFVRQLRLVMHGRVEHVFEAVNYFEEPGASYLKSINPINKLPLLLEGEQKIFDSRVIYNHLSRKHNWKPLTLDEENYVSAIYGAMDTCANLFLLRRGGLDTNAKNWYVERQQERIPSILDFVQPWMQSLNPERREDWTYPAMSLFSFLYWTQFRGMIDMSDRPAFLQFLQDFKAHPGIAETEPPK